VIAVVDLATLGFWLLHGGVSHVTETSSGGFEWWQAAASVLLVGSVGGALYWYYGRQLQSP